MAAVGIGFDLAAFFKSPEGAQRLMDQIPFIAKGMILQGYNQAPFETAESQVSDEEILSYDDIDGTKDQVWVRRRQRLESRNIFKNQEYEQRRQQLRTIRNQILEAMERDQKLGLEPNSVNKLEIAAIDKRMLKLAPLEVAVSVGEPEVPAVSAEPPPRVQCGHCDEVSPEGHTDPLKWKRGHEMGAHTHKKGKSRRAS